MAGPSHAPALYRDRDVVPVRRALVSVSDKTDLLVLAEALAGAGVEIVSTGGSATMLREAGLRDREMLDAFLERHAATMPRTALRSALEKHDAASRQDFMARRST